MKLRNNKKGIKKNLFLLGQIWTSMTSSYFNNSPCPIAILRLVIELTNKFMVVPWAALCVLLWQISAWNRSRNLQLVIHPFFLSKNWRRYFDDSFCIIRKDGVSAFPDTFKSINWNILFQIELEYDGRIHFLDTLVSRRNGAIAIVYRQPKYHHDYSQECLLNIRFRRLFLPHVYFT